MLKQSSGVAGGTIDFDQTRDIEIALNLFLLGSITVRHKLRQELGMDMPIAKFVASAVGCHDDPWCCLFFVTLARHSLDEWFDGDIRGNETELNKKLCKMNRRVKRMRNGLHSIFLDYPLEKEPPTGHLLSNVVMDSNTGFVVGERLVQWARMNAEYWAAGKHTQEWDELRSELEMIAESRYNRPKDLATRDYNDERIAVNYNQRAEPKEVYFLDSEDRQESIVTIKSGLRDEWEEDREPDWMRTRDFCLETGKIEEVCPETGKRTRVFKTIRRPLPNFGIYKNKSYIDQGVRQVKIQTGPEKEVDYQFVMPFNDDIECYTILGKDTKRTTEPLTIPREKKIRTWLVGGIGHKGEWDTVEKDHILMTIGIEVPRRCRETP